MKIIRNEQNGVEFFTLKATGESGLNQTGLAVLSGVSQPAINQLITALISKAPSKWLEPWLNKELTLISNHSSSDQKTRNITIYKAEFCAAVIQHYAFKGNETAQQSLHNFSAAGITLWIQRQTQWQPVHQKPESLAKHTSNEIKEIYSNVAHISPRLCQFLIDHAVNELMGDKAQLPGTSAPLAGVVEIATDLGYLVHPNTASNLGKYVKRHCSDIAQIEKRLVGGGMRDVYLYPSDHPQVIKAIHTFFNNQYGLNNHEHE